MKKTENAEAFTEVFKLLIIVIFVYKFSGTDGLKNLFMGVKGILGLFNLTGLKLYGESILSFLFTTKITFLIVGILFTYLGIKKGLFGKIFGKLSFKTINGYVSNILNIISKFIFR